VVDLDWAITVDTMDFHVADTPYRIVRSKAGEYHLLNTDGACLKVASTVQTSLAEAIAFQTGTVLLFCTDGDLNHLVNSDGVCFHCRQKIEQSEAVGM
jgi:hypothetical protein